MTQNETDSSAKTLALQQVSAPATGLLVTGIVGAAVSLLTIMGTGLGSLTHFGRRWADDMPDWYGEMFEGFFAMGFSVVGLAIAGFIIFAALKMKDLQQWGVAVAASVLAVIPCVSPCCVLGLPIGIWCLVVLMRPDVKDAFL